MSTIEQTLLRLQKSAFRAKFHLSEKDRQYIGLEMAIGYCILGCLWCITILGIPIGKQCFKMAKLSLMPFGASVV